MLVGLNSLLTPICRCSKWRSTHSLRRGIHWACAVTSACTYSVASWAPSSVDTTEHVLRPHTGARARAQTRARAGGQTRARARYGIHFSSYDRRRSYVRTIINNRVLQCWLTPRSEYKTRGGKEGRGGEAGSTGAPKEGVPNRGPSASQYKDSCHCNTWDIPITTEENSKGGLHLVLLLQQLLN